MNKKILICSIISVIILILVSFTSVIGYRSISSDVKESPLFTVRTSRAINKESNDLRCYYFGKGEEYDLSIPKRDIETSRIQKVLDIISKMNDIEISNLLQVIHNIRSNPNVLKNYDKKDILIDETVEPVSCRWFPGCYIANILIEIAASIIGFITTLLHCFPVYP
ncbi:MAG: hypothetical protein JSW06_09710 [Thermoplasmatales archaeon]|nr:MAG: hypothetical protein JSW06_09710 [Thermoplasmatales archaeon]